jgi:hypothetical protein
MLLVMFRPASATTSLASSVALIVTFMVELRGVYSCFVWRQFSQLAKKET